MKVYKEDLKPYLNGYLYGKTTVAGLAKQFDCSLSVISRTMNLLMNDLINNKEEEQTQFLDKLVIPKENNFNFDNDLTIGDWGTMTEEQKEQYNKTELNYEKE